MSFPALNAIVFRDTKGSPLTSAEGDGNLDFLNRTKLDKLNVTDKVSGKNSSNLVVNGSGELGFLGWSDPLSILGASANLLGDGNLFTNAAAFTANFTATGQQIPCGPGVNLNLGGEIATLLMTQGVVGIRFDCYQSNGTFISSIGGGTVAFGQPYTFVNSTGATPALTAYVVPVIYSTGVSASQPALSVKVRRIKGEQGATPSLYSNEAAIATVYAQASIGSERGQCRLFIDATVTTGLRLFPFNGNQLFINGVPQTIPNAGVFLAGTATAAGVYYIYAYMNAGVMTLESSATKYERNTITGQYQKIGDPTRSLVGLAYNQGNSYAPLTGALSVLSYYNRRPLTIGSSTNGLSLGAGVNGIFAGCNTLSWGDDALRAEGHSTCTSSGVATANMVLTKAGSNFSLQASVSFFQGSAPMQLFALGLVAGNELFTTYNVTQGINAGNLTSQSTTCLLYVNG